MSNDYCPHSEFAKRIRASIPQLLLSLAQYVSGFHPISQETMPAIPCPHAPECDYVTDSQARISEAITLLQMHERAKHEQQEATSNSLEADKVRRPTITGGASSEHW